MPRWPRSRPRPRRTTPALRLPLLGVAAPAIVQRTRRRRRRSLQQVRVAGHAVQDAIAHAWRCRAGPGSRWAAAGREAKGVRRPSHSRRRAPHEGAACCEQKVLASTRPSRGTEGRSRSRSHGTVHGTAATPRRAACVDFGGGGFTERPEAGGGTTAALPLRRCNAHLVAGPGVSCRQRQRIHPPWLGSLASEWDPNGS